MNILETRAISYEYRGGIPALQDVSVRIPKGGSIALLGSNGAGKSTLMKHLNGILMPKSGEVLVHGELVTKQNLRHVRQTIGMVFQDPDDQVFAPTVEEDVAFGPINMGLSHDEVSSRVQDALTCLEIEHLAHRPPHQLSGGEKKRVAIAGILAMRSEILVLDEPTSGLDPAGIRELLLTLKTLMEKQGITLIFSTHHVDLVPELADYGYIMHEGRVIGEGTVDQLFHNLAIIETARLELPILSRLISSLRQKGVSISTGHRFDDVESALLTLLQKEGGVA